MRVAENDVSDDELGSLADFIDVDAASEGPVPVQMLVEEEGVELID